MKRTLVLAIGLLSVSLASGTYAFDKKHDKAIAAEAQPLGFTKTKSRFLDSVYLKPGINFSDYTQLDLTPLDTSSTSVREPTGPNEFDEPWILTEKDKAYLQQRYLETFTKELITSKRFSGGSGKTLRIKTTLQEIAPSAPKDDLKSRPNIGKFYTEGAGTMTMKMEIYDAETNGLVGLIADEADVGNQWEENNRATNHRQLGLSFTRWADSLGVALGKK